MFLIWMKLQNWDIIIQVNQPGVTIYRYAQFVTYKLKVVNETAAQK